MTTCKCSRVVMSSTLQVAKRVLRGRTPNDEALQPWMSPYVLLTILGASQHNQDVTQRADSTNHMMVATAPWQNWSDTAGLRKQHRHQTPCSETTLAMHPHSCRSIVGHSVQTLTKQQHPATTSSMQPAVALHVLTVADKTLRSTQTLSQPHSCRTAPTHAARIHTCMHSHSTNAY